MTNELTDVRCPCGAEFQADSYDAGFIAGSGMCQNCDAALPPKDICTCPSGDGSLRHPCPAHPAPVEQAEAEVAEVIGYMDGNYRRDQPSIYIPHVRIVKSCGKGEALMTVSQHERIVEARWNRAMDLLLDHVSRISEKFKAERDAALAQPSPAQAEQAEAERPEVVAWQYRVTAGPQTGWSLWHPGKGEEFERSYTVERRPLMTVAQHECIVGELRAVIAQLRQHKNDYMDSGQETYRALQNEIREREAEIARLDGLVSGRTAERDAALARVAELERQEPVALANRGLHAFWVKWTEAAAGLYGPGIKLYAAPVAQAQHSVPAYVSYTTRPAESLAGIALRQLKDESRWVEIRDINAHAFPDMQSHSYYPAGTVIKLPAAAPGKEEV
ncbi:LysM peptidoglycan-binding domain-containing protein [Pseudomonas aeruginosa]|uniref:LysM peptidoglycan-binding domain-containing protein n=1 Tax=Pseudomonas aeruginosa TaxID=287 RepID=UPI0018C65A6B|nr:hypothetical protein [Pseudomonas aeruginosa]